MSNNESPEPHKTKAFNSRFVEHFDFIPPPELLEIIEEGSHISSLDNQDDVHSRLNKNLASFFKATSSKPSKILIADPLIFSNSSNISSTSPVSLTMSPNNSFSSNELSNTNNTAVRHRSQSNPIIPLAPLNESTLAEPKAIPATKKKEPNNARITLNTNHSMPADIHMVSKKSQVAPQSKPRITRRQLNFAGIYIQRYDSWYQFLTHVLGWLNEIIRTTSQSERMFQSFLKEAKWMHKDKENSSAKEVHHLVHGFTTDLAQQEQQFVKMLKKHVPGLEALKKECATQIKKIKSRSDLSQEELLRRAEVTVQYMSQLTKMCKEARRTIEKGAQLTSDPWLANLCKVY